MKQMPLEYTGNKNHSIVVSVVKQVVGGQLLILVAGKVGLDHQLPREPQGFELNVSPGL